METPLYSWDLLTDRVAIRDLGELPEDLTHQELSYVLGFFLSEAPDSRSHCLKFRTAGVACNFHADFRTECITRQRLFIGPPALAVAEMWHGDIGERLKSAINGGSLDDTAQGQSPPIVLHLDPSPHITRRPQ